jgi:hypothetical protein
MSEPIPEVAAEDVELDERTGEGLFVDNIEVLEVLDGN